MVETAVRLAIESVMNVLCGVNSARTHELQRLVEDREREIQKLEGRLRDTESELRLLRREGCTCPSTVSPCEPPEGSEERECEVSISLGLLTGPLSQSGLDQTCSSLSSEALSVSVPVPLSHCPTQTSHCPPQTSHCPPVHTVHSVHSVHTVQVKEEPTDSLLQWEGTAQTVSPTAQDQLTHPDQWPSVAPETEDPPVTNQELLRSRRRSVPLSELSEEAKRLKRAAWRAASKRYYARKVARQQQAHPSTSSTQQQAHPSPMCTPHQPFSCPKTRRRPIAELPEATQSQQREAWRLASRKYYARKLSQATARLAHIGSYNQSAPILSQPAPNYSQSAPTYSQPAPTYSQPSPIFAHSSDMLGDITYS